MWRSGGTQDKCEPEETDERGKKRVVGRDEDKFKKRSKTVT